MKECGTCGILNNDGNPSCHSCHAPFADSPSSPPPTTSRVTPPTNSRVQARPQSTPHVAVGFAIVGSIAAVVVLLVIFAKVAFYHLLARASLGLLLAGLVSLLVPLKFIGIRNRKAGFVLVILGFVLFAVFNNLWEKNLPAQEQAKLAAERQQRKDADAREEAEKKQELERQRQAATQAEQRSKEPDNAALIAAALNDQFQQRGADIKVYGFDNVLVFDCTKALDPRSACYVLYKGYPQSDELKILRVMGVRKIHYQTQGGVFSGYAWTKDIQ